MPLLGNNAGVPFVSGGALLLPPDGVACECCPRYDCVPGGVDCQGCVQTDDGPYRSLAECEPECPPQTCVWCVERDVLGPCNTTYVTYECTQTGCDEDGDCIAPEQAVVAGPLKTEDVDDVACFNEVCPDPPDPPPVPECCVEGDCPPCHQCVDGSCVEGCPPGYICYQDECVPPEDYYYCCRDISSCTGDCTWESAQQAPPPFGDGSFYWLNTVACESPEACDCISPEDPPTEIGQVTYTSCTSSGSGSGTGTCQQGPCGPEQVLASGPHGSLADCCAVCGCAYDCAVPGYYCFPDPLGGYDTLAECEAACEAPGTTGACCYTIAPYSEDNQTLSPTPGCSLVRGCFGVMTFAECEALKTDTGTNTTWQSEYQDCNLCPATESRVCCYADEDDPCIMICTVTDESCCESVSGNYYTALESCEDTWPSGADACRTDIGCDWPMPVTEETSGSPYQVRSLAYASPAVAYLYLSCIQQPQWKAGYPEGLVDCDWRWVRDFSRCAGGAAAEDHACERFRVMRLSGDTIVDITSRVIDNPEELECCVCVRNYGNSPCIGGECIPSPFFADPEADCLP